MPGRELGNGETICRYLREVVLPSGTRQLLAPPLESGVASSDVEPCHEPKSTRPSSQCHRCASPGCHRPATPNGRVKAKSRDPVCQTAKSGCMTRSPAPLLPVADTGAEPRGANE